MHFVQLPESEICNEKLVAPSNNNAWMPDDAQTPTTTFLHSERKLKE